MRQEKVFGNAEKTLDKRPNLWYNKITKGQLIVRKTEKEVDTMKTMSYSTAVSNAIEGNLDAETLETLGRLKVSLDKRNSNRSGKPTKTQIANAEIGEAIVSAMSVGEAYSINDIAGLVPALEGATPQKVSPIMSKLVKAERVTCEKVKGKNVYRLA